MTTFPHTLFFFVYTTELGVEVQRLGRFPPIKEIQTAHVEALMKDKEGKHTQQLDQTRLPVCMHGPALHTEMALEINQLKKQLEKLMEYPFAKIHIHEILTVAYIHARGVDKYIVADNNCHCCSHDLHLYFGTFTLRILSKHNPWP